MKPLLLPLAALLASAAVAGLYWWFPPWSHEQLTHPGVYSGSQDWRKTTCCGAGDIHIAIQSMANSHSASGGVCIDKSLVDSAWGVCPIICGYNGPIMQVQMPDGKIIDLSEGQITDRWVEQHSSNNGDRLFNVLAMYDQSGHETFGNTWWRYDNYGGVVLEHGLHGYTFFHMMRDQWGVCDDPAVMTKSTPQQP